MISDIYLALLEISLLLFAAEGSRGLTTRLGLPVLVGELLIGIVLGPYAFGRFVNLALGIPLLTLNNYTELFAEFSVILLIFASGLEEGVAGVRRAGAWSFLGAAAGALLPFLAIVAVFWAGLGLGPALLLGAASAATSLAAVSNVVRGTGIRGRALDFLMTAGAVDDVAALMLLSVAIAVAQGQAEPSRIFAVTLYYAASWAIISVASIYILPRMANVIGHRYAFSFALLSLFGLVAAMVSLGFSPIIAAYIAGISLSTSRFVGEFKRLATGLTSLFGPLFFVIAGAAMNPLVLGAYPLALALTGLALAFKFIGVYPFAYASTRDIRRSAVVSMGMTPRGEVGLAVAAAGVSAGILVEAYYSAAVLMALLTTLIGGIAFSALAKRVCGPATAQEAGELKNGNDVQG